LISTRPDSEPCEDSQRDTTKGTYRQIFFGCLEVTAKNAP
jgi:hypothetical protein